MIKIKKKNQNAKYRELRPKVIGVAFLHLYRLCIILYQNTEMSHFQVTGYYTEKCEPFLFIVADVDVDGESAPGLRILLKGRESGEELILMHVFHADGYADVATELWYHWMRAQEVATKVRERKDFGRAHWALWDSIEEEEEDISDSASDTTLDGSDGKFPVLGDSEDDLNLGWPAFWECTEDVMTPMQSWFWMFGLYSKVAESAMNDDPYQQSKSPEAKAKAKLSMTTQLTMTAWFVQYVSHEPDPMQLATFETFIGSKNEKSCNERVLHAAHESCPVFKIVFPATCFKEFRKYYVTVCKTVNKEFKMCLAQLDYGDFSEMFNLHIFTSDEWTANAIGESFKYAMMKANGGLQDRIDFTIERLTVEQVRTAEALKSPRLFSDDKENDILLANEWCEWYSWEYVFPARRFAFQSPEVPEIPEVPEEVSCPATAAMSVSQPRRMGERRFKKKNGQRLLLSGLMP
jgi:hypothetical protein